MESNEIFRPSVDKSLVPPLHQKRIVALLHHFTVNTCLFLNDFVTRCETKFVEVENKLQRLEARLLITEAKLASVPELQNVQPALVENKTECDTEPISPKNDVEINPIESEPIDINYLRFLKMLQVGVPLEAVKSKMKTEGYDPELLNKTEFQNYVKKGSS